jgi:pimeloyl-ACP methyl ester carboxylesterase
MDTKTNGKNAYYTSMIKEITDKFLITNGAVCSDDNTSIYYSDINQNTNKGILVIPGLTVPRESYFTLIELGFTIRFFDLRGQGQSGGYLSFEKHVSDLAKITDDFKRRYGFENVTMIGHSYGSLVMLKYVSAYQPDNCSMICLAPPLNIKDITLSIRTLIFAYAYILWRSLKKQYSDQICRKHQHLSLIQFFKQPSIVAMRIDKIDDFNMLREKTPDLKYLVQSLDNPGHFVFSEDDKRIKFKEKRKNFEKLFNMLETKGSKFKILKGLDHRFNKGKSTVFRIGHNSELLLEYLKMIV